MWESVVKANDPKRNLFQFVRWPKYIRIQRHKAVLQKRLKIPPPINQFSQALDKHTAQQLFKLLEKYRPENPIAKIQYLWAKEEAAPGCQHRGQASQAPEGPAHSHHHLVRRRPH
ncbi:hypothetical protein pipiens_015928 [Culex pipiens pipiens]|uniref:60S ribosomal protein L7a n=1 Tax=Culex pipiens pipiens TaxID=38569 RepID=A0ABD1CND9_CULPP